MKTVIGIDPGVSGGIAVIWPDGSSPAEVHKMPESPAGIWARLQSVLIRANSGMPIAFIENVHPMPREGVSSVWTFAQNVAHLEMACYGLGIRLERVTPQRWQAGLGIAKRESIPNPNLGLPMPEEEYQKRKKAYQQALAAAKRDHKNQLKRCAEQRFPTCKVTLATCDALLICDYGCRLLRGEETSE